jgi:hypothetical protein
VAASHTNAEKCTAARRLIAQARSKRVGVDRHQNQIAPAGEVPRRRLGGLRGCGKVNEAVRDIDRRAGEDANAFRLIPQRYVADFVDDRQNMPLCRAGPYRRASSASSNSGDMDKPSFYSYKAAWNRMNLPRNGGSPWRTNARC